jgi:hypothetical protein
MKDNAISLDGFWGVVTRLNNDVKRCMSALVELAEADDEEEKAFWRRMYAHAVFAMIDGATYCMTFHAYAARGRPDVVFSRDELTRLEKSYDFDEDQEAVTTFSKTLMLENIRFAFNVFARVHYSDYILPIQDPDWILIKEIAHIKESLQYPREPLEVEVYEEYIDDLVEGLLWLVQRMVELLADCQKHLQEKIAEWESGEDEIVM